jgi:glycogen(starch) synthase
MVARRYGWAAIAARTAAVYRRAAGGTAASRAEARARLASGRPSIVVPEGNLLAT